MKAILITAALGLLLSGVQQYRLMSCQKGSAQAKAAVTVHNAAVDTAAATGKADAAQAGERALRVLNQGAELRRRLPAGTGPVVMNQFMRELFE